LGKAVGSCTGAPRSFRKVIASNLGGKGNQKKRRKKAPKRGGDLRGWCLRVICPKPRKTGVEQRCGEDPASLVPLVLYRGGGRGRVFLSGRKKEVSPKLGERRWEEKAEMFIKVYSPFEARPQHFLETLGGLVSRLGKKKKML